MPQSVLIKSLGETWEFPDEASPAQIQDAIKTQLGSIMAPKMSPAPNAQGFLRNYASEGEDTGGLDRKLDFAGNVARGAVADVAAGMSLLKRPDNQPPSLLPPVGDIPKAIQSNMAGAADASGNIVAAVQEKPLPIDSIVSEAAKEDKNTALVAHLSQGLSASAPMLAVIGGLPGAVQKVAVAAFTADMIRHAPEIARGLGEQYGLPPEQRDPNKIAQLESQAIQTVGFSALGGAHVGKSVVEAMRLRSANAPATAAVVEEINRPTEVINEPITPVGEQPAASGVSPLPAEPAPVTAATEPPLNPGGAFKDLPPELQAKDQGVAQREAWKAQMLADLAKQSNEALRQKGADKVEAVPAETTKEATPAPIEDVATAESKVGETTPEAISTEPSVTPDVTQSKVKIGRSPQPYTVLEKLPQSALEKANGEQPIRVKNDKTGEEQVVLEGDTKAIKGTQGSVGAGALQPVYGPPVSLPVKSQRQIITDLAKGLDIPIRFGRLTTTKFAGYFKSLQNLIGIKKAGDLPTASHEVGHKIDSTFQLSSDPAIASELNVLGDPTTPGSASSWTASKGANYKLGEGMAEFVRYFLTDPAKARAEAPNTYSAFEKVLDANKDMGDTLRQAQSDIQVWRNAPAQARLRSQISVGDNPNKTPYTLSQLTRDVVDDLHILRKATEAAEAGVGKDLPPSENPYLLARSLRGSYGMADTFVRHGPVDFKSRAVEMGKSLQDALKPIAGRLNDFRDWIVAKRAQELSAQGKESGILKADADEVAKQFNADPAFQKAFSDIKQWQDKLLQYTVDAGLISKESAKAMRDMNADYVPFHRVFEVGAGEPSSAQGSGTGMGLNVGNPASLKRLRGSTRQIVDPLETMVKNAYTLITAAEKANINRAVADLADKPNMGKWVERVATPKEKVQFELQRIKDQLTKAGANVANLPDDLLLSFFKTSSKSPYGENIIRVIKNGEPQFYRLNRDLHDTFQALDLEDSGKLIKILSAPAQLLRAGVTLDPAFSLANAVRDTFSAAVISKYGALPLETTLKGFGAMIGNPKLVAEWAGSGGKSSVEAHFFDRKAMQKWLTQKISKDLTPAERATVVLKSPLTAMRMISGAFEEATRIGEYKIALDKLQKGGMPEGEARRLAAFEARDRQDFAKGGAKTKILRHMTAFWNAGLQANVKLASAFRRRPIQTLAAGFAFVTIPKLLEQAVNWDDQDYWDRPQWERDAFFLIPNGKGKDGHTSFIRIPTPFEIGVIFGTLPGRVLQYAKEKNPEAVKDFPAVALKGAMPNPVPQWMQAIFENFLSGPKGWDTFRGRQIVPERIAELPLDQQYTEQTSAAAKALGNLLGMSPMKVDHLIEQSTGGVGKIFSGKQVPGQRFVTRDLTSSNEPENKFYQKLDEFSRQAKGGKETYEHILLDIYADVISTIRSAERAAETEDEKRSLREDIFQIQKTALEGIKNPPKLNTEADKERVKQSILDSLKK